MYKPILKTRFIGKNIEYLSSCHSTNDIAAHKVRSGEATDGEIIITDEQLAGRGQRGNRWESEKKMNFTFSIILRPEKLCVADQFLLPQSFALGVHQYVASLVGARAMIKWPNDILIDEKKIVGMSFENTIRGSIISTAIVGIGLNMNQLNFSHPRSSSLALATGRRFDLVAELDALVACLDAYYSRLIDGEYASLSDDYHERLFGLGQKRSFESEGKTFEGVVIGVAPDGRLRVDVGGEERIYGIKEITWLW